MVLNIHGFEVRITARRLGERADEDFLNELALVYNEASSRMASLGAFALANSFREAGADAHQALEAKGYYADEEVTK